MNVSTKKKLKVHNFETLKYNLPDNTADILLDHSSDPDLNFFNTNFQSLNTPYFSPGEFHNVINTFAAKGFSETRPFKRIEER